MIQNEDYIEFDLKALFFYILRQWKFILIVAACFALLLGGYKAYSEYRTSLNVDMENSYWREYQQYQEQVAFLNDRVSTTQKKFDNLKEYIEHSVLMESDYRNINIAKAVYYVDSDYKILPENTFQDTDKTYTLSWYYLNYLSDYSVFEEIGEEIGIEAKYLMELVDVSMPNDWTIAISVSHPLKQSAENIMDVVKKKLEEVHLYLYETVSNHTITVMSDTCGVYIDDQLKEKQQDAYDELLELQDDLIAYKEDLYALQEANVPGELNIIFTFIKWLILGVCLGSVVAVIVIFIKSVLKNRVHSPRQIVSALNVTILGEVMKVNGRLPVINRGINKLEGCLVANSEENYQFLAENIKNHCGTAKNVIVCCDINSGISADVAEAVNKYLTDIKLLPIGDVLKEASALQNLSKCDAVIVVAVRDESKNSTLKKITNLIQSYKKETLGFIVTY